MLLSEKILTLRTARNLSQGDLAEALEVSRQSVSKWETGQSVPDLDKIIKLADLFGVSVDELVREGERPQPPQPEERVVYIEREKSGLRPVQVIGVILEVLGAGMFLLGLVAGAVLSVFGLLLVLLGLPLLLARKHPFLICGWVIAGLCYGIFNPYVTATPANLFAAVRFLVVVLRNSKLELLRGGTGIGVSIAIARGALTLLLLSFTLYTWNKNRKKKDG